MRVRDENIDYVLVLVFTELRRTEKVPPWWVTTDFTMNLEQLQVIKFSAKLHTG